jgi:hypothetical protein
MSPTIWLIVEDEDDGLVIRQLLRAKAIKVRLQIRAPSGRTGGISRLARQLERLIATIKSSKSDEDCIAVLHDADEQNQQRYRGEHERVEEICRQEMVAEIVARDELEAWLLADGGLCKWLQIRPRNCDSEAQPSNRFRRLVSQKTGRSYNVRHVLPHLDGSGDGRNRSPSMRRAMKHLDNSPCMQAETS